MGLKTVERDSWLIIGCIWLGLESCYIYDILFGMGFPFVV